MGEKVATLYAELGVNSDKARDALSSFSKDLLKVAGGAIAVGKTLEKAFDLGKEGASVTQLRESFDRLTQRFGAGTDLLERLRSASRDTVDDLTLMSSTMLLLQGVSDEFGKQLTAATPQLLEMAKAANKLNPELGDVAFLYDSLARGIKRSSPLILDNLGIIVKVGEANEKFAKSIGKSVDELTAEETKMALLNATLEAGKVMIDQAGGSVDSATDKFSRLEATTKNLGNAIKEKLAPFLADAADGLYQLLTYEDRMNSVMAEHNQTMLASAKTYEEYIREMARAKMVSIGFAAEEALVISQTKDLNALVSEGTRLYGFSTEAQFNLGRAIAYVKDETYTVADATEGWIQRQEQLAGVLGNTSTSMTDYSVSLSVVNASMKELNRETLFQIATEGLNAEQTLAAARAMHMIDEATLMQLESAQKLNQELLAGNINLTEYTQRLTKLDWWLRNIPKDIKIMVSTAVSGVTTGNVGQLPGGATGGGGGTYGYGSTTNNNVTINVNGAGDPYAVSQQVGQTVRDAY